MRELDFSKKNLAEVWEEVKEDFWEDFNSQSLTLTRKIVEETLGEEMAIRVGALRHERSEKRVGYRNGHYRRDLVTRMGVLEGIKVPRCRDGGFRTKVFVRYKRYREEVEEAVRRMFLAGVSTRRVGDAIKPLLGASMSAQTVSRITRSLDQEVRRFHSRALSDEYRYLFLDGVSLKVRDGVRVRKKSILVAYGIRWDGRREIIDFCQVGAESTASWEAFLNDLFLRGLLGKRLELIISDGSPAIKAALELVYGKVPHQRCWAHKLRNVVAKLKKRDQEECISQAREIYNAPHRREAIEAFWRWARRWRKVAPKAVECLEKDLEELLAHFDCPLEHRKRIRTTNVIERSFREVRRRIRPMSSFKNKKSCDRIIYGITHHLNEQWEKKPLKEFTQKS